MACSLLLALTCVAAASAASYIDYGVKMPQYGGSADYESGRDPPPSQPSDDYHSNSPDAPASLDYKYEEEPRIKTEKPVVKDSDEIEGWRKSGRKHRELVRPSKIDASIRNKFDHDDDEIPKFRTNRRYSKHRSRLKNEIEEDTLPRRHNKYSRDRKDDSSELDRKDYLHVDKDYVPDDKNKEFDDDVKFMREVTTKRPNRRRPREREFKRRHREDILNEYVEDAISEAPKSDIELEPETLRADMRRLRTTEIRMPHEHARFAPHGEDEDEAREDPREEPREEPVKGVPGKFKAKGYDEYDDYYDMKRVHNIKNKLPSLLRRTTVRRIPSKTKMDSNLLEMLLTNRRMMGPAGERSSLSSAKPRSTTTNATQTTTASTTNTTTQASTTKNETADLSLAEKSRLSILKKAQRKEGMNFHATEKPPVLLQVTSYMPTVVMVEPPSSTVPWLRSKELEEDSPARIELVKRLMRHKLVAEAKSIHDLTDNWDEMICDYIDMSILDSAATILSPNMHLSVLCLLLCVFVFSLL